MNGAFSVPVLNCVPNFPLAEITILPLESFTHPPVTAALASVDVRTKVVNDIKNVLKIFSRD